jgi:glycosyltransferase involved in cell wall biosynthesis
MGGSPRRLKVLYLFAGSRYWYYQDFLRGIVPDTRLLGLNHLSKWGIDAEFLEIPPAQWLRKVNFNLVHLPYLPVLPKYDAVFLGAGFPLVFLVRKVLRWKKPAIVLFNTSYGNLLRRHSGGTVRRFLLAALGGADAIACVSNAQRNALVEFGLDPDRMQFIPLGVDCSPAPSEEPDEGYILSVGRDIARDYRTLFAAVENLPDTVRVICSPKNVAELTPPANVRLDFDLPYDQLPDIYRQAGLVVVPVRGADFLAGSDASGQYGYLEPMVYAKAVIVSRRPGVEDYISHGQDGLLVPPEDPAALRQAIVRLRDSKEERRRLGEAARRKVEREFSTVRFAERLAELFYRLTGRPNPNPE